MTLPLVPAIVFLLGLVVYFVGDGKVAEVGRAAVWIGLALLVWVLSGR